MLVVDISTIAQFLWIILFILIITGLNQRIQMLIWIFDIKTKLNIIRNILEDDKNKLRSMLRNLGVKAPDIVLNRIFEFSIIEPVEVEPTDIIKRMDHLLRTAEKTVRGIIKDTLPSLGKHERSLIESSISIVAAINQVYKVMRHYLLLGEKENNFLLIYQLEFLMPQVMRMVNVYHEALDSFMNGRPIGDGIGPLVIYNLAERNTIKSRRVVDDTDIIEIQYKDRRVLLVKAEGPGSNVAHPGAVISKIIEDLKGNIDLVITIDAALKLEGEESGSIMEGVGAAIGDPGPEKIAIERATTKYNITLRALLVKMDLKEAITTMRREIFESVEKVISYIDRMIEEQTKPHATILIAGIGNSMGIPG